MMHADQKRFRAIGADRVAVAILIACVLLVTWTNIDRRSVFDLSGQFTDIAFNLATTGSFAWRATDDGEAQPTIIREPAYPAYLAIGMAALLGAPPPDIACLLESPSSCPDLRDGLVFMHMFLLVAIALLIYAAAVWLCGRGWLAVLAVALFLFQGNAIFYAAATFVSEPLATLLLTAHAFAIALLAQNPGRRWVAIVAGVSLGLLVLTKAIFLFYIFGGLAILIAMTFFSRGRHSAAFVPLSWIVLIALAMASAWVARNIVVVDTVQFTQRGHGLLLRRAEYDMMTWDEAFAGLVYYAPYVGEDLAAAYLEPGQYEMLSTHNVDGYHVRIKYDRGVVNARQQANIDALGGRYRNLVKMLTPLQVMAENPVKHVAVSGLLMWRGMAYETAGKWTGIDAVDRRIGFAARMFSVLLLPAMVWAAIRAWRRRRRPVLVFLLPSLYVVVSHALITDNVPRHIEPTIPCAIVALCWLIRDTTAIRGEKPGLAAIDQP
ncbi:MAG: hypothetical protein GY791_09730 [Alphaproteobacteria bacterium]|nr:hypothetical protein [Alphaproteobacteria bacterium]